MADRHSTYAPTVTWSSTSSMTDRHSRATQRFIRMVVGSPRRASLKQRHSDVRLSIDECDVSLTVPDQTVSSDLTHLKTMYESSVAARQTMETAPRTFPRIASSRRYGKPWKEQQLLTVGSGGEVSLAAPGFCACGMETKDPQYCKQSCN